MLHLLILLTLSLSPNDPRSMVEQNNPTSRELEMIDEINAVRTNPKAYIKYIDVYTDLWDSGPSELKAAKELKKELSTINPLDSLFYSQSLYNMCFSHGKWMKRTGKFQHSSYNIAENLVYGDENVRMALLSLLIDAGVPNRGHRKNILNPNYTKVACVEVEGTVGGDQFVFVQGFDF